MFRVNPLGVLAKYDLYYPRIDKQIIEAYVNYNVNRYVRLLQ
jgi:hypothetical protein